MDYLGGISPTFSVYLSFSLSLSHCFQFISGYITKEIIEQTHLERRTDKHELSIERDRQTEEKNETLKLGNVTFDSEGRDSRTSQTYNEAVFIRGHCAAVMLTHINTQTHTRTLFVKHKHVLVSRDHVQ